MSSGSGSNSKLSEAASRRRVKLSRGLQRQSIGCLRHHTPHLPGLMENCRVGTQTARRLLQQKAAAELQRQRTPYCNGDEAEQTLLGQGCPCGPSVTRMC